MLTSDFKCHFSTLLNQSCNNNSFNLFRQLVAGQLIRFVHPKLNCISASLNSVFLIQFCHYCSQERNSLLLTAEEQPAPDKALKHEYTRFLLRQPGVLFKTLRQRMSAPELVTRGLVRGGKQLLLGHGPFNLFWRLIILYSKLDPIRALQDAVI